MADEFKLRKDLERGSHAEMLLRDELLTEAFKTLEAAYIEEWGRSEFSQVEKRENLWKSTQILGDVRRHLLKVASNGKLAKKELNDLADKFRPRAA